MMSLSTDLIYPILNYYIATQEEYYTASKIGMRGLKTYMDFKALTLGIVPLKWNAFSLEKSPWANFLRDVSTEMAHLGCFAGEYFASLLFEQVPDKTQDINFYCSGDKYPVGQTFVDELCNYSGVELKAVYYQHLAISIRLSYAGEERMVHLIYKTVRHIPHDVVAQFGNNYSRCGLFNGQTFATADALYAYNARRALHYQVVSLPRQYNLTDTYCSKDTFDTTVNVEDIIVVGNLFYKTVYLAPCLPILNQVYFEVSFRQYVEEIEQAIPIRFSFHWVYIADEKLTYVLDIMKHLYKPKPFEQCSQMRPRKHIHASTECYGISYCGKHGTNLVGFIKVSPELTNEQRKQQYITIRFSLSDELDMHWTARVV